MSFGVSIGDIILVGKHIADITKILQGGAKSEYQQLFHQLHSLQYALQQVKHLVKHSDSSTTLDGLKHATLSCEHRLREFLSIIKKYEPWLGSSSKRNAFKSTFAKLGWYINMQEEVQKLQRDLSVQVGIINMHLLAKPSRSRRLLWELAHCWKVSSRVLRIGQSPKEHAQSTQEHISTAFVHCEETKASSKKHKLK